MSETNNKTESNENSRDKTLEQQIDDIEDEIKGSTKEIKKNKAWMIFFPIVGILVYVISRIPEFGAGGEFNIGSLSISHSFVGLLVCTFFFYLTVATYRENKNLKKTIAEKKDEMKKLTSDKE